MKRKKLNVFSLSFLDIITCGLGAIILLFVLINAKSAAHQDAITSDFRAEVSRMESLVLNGKKHLAAPQVTLGLTSYKQMMAGIFLAVTPIPLEQVAQTI